MATANYDILMTDDGDDLIEGGDFAVGDGTLDDCVCIFKLNSGSLKMDPVLGPNLVLMTNKNISAGDIKRELGLHLERDNKRYKSLSIKDGKIGIEL